MTKTHKYPRLRRALIWAIGAVVVILVVATAAASVYMLNFSLRPDADYSHNLQSRLRRTLNDCPQLRPWVDSLLQTHALRDTFVVMPTGERHHAVYVRAAKATNRVAILVHGYTDNSMGMIHIASIYGRMGFNLLLPDLHAHGKSQGEGIQMGWKERLDVMEWLRVADDMFAGGGNGSQIVVHGVSMGAATTMSLSGERLPKSVRCLVEDCGYTSAWDEFEYQLADMFHLPAFPLLYTTSILCKIRYGWSFGEASSLRQVGKCRLPMLFIHGDKDTYVPFSMLQQLYNAKPQPKEMWIAPGSIHATSFRDHPDEYGIRVRGFVGKYIR